MLERLLSLFHTDKAVTPLPQADERHALGALLVRAAKIDRAYLFEEVEEIDHVLARLYGLNAVEAAKMRARCEKLEAAMPDTKALAEVLHQHIADDHLEDAVRALWSVVFSDGFEEAEQDDLLHQIEAILGVAPGRAKELHDEEMAKSGLF
ncbi:TerB family tellurite resistance protein [Loktanella sp. SALINAS62]|uniref:tellurite resistance TerB family protein n=1 Tax=Loktanella sp. SALINAS62 TaxID=2706124 RepID=UPI001B8B9F9C|nr:TerB family tellurite resistance protein [Loktanella sp. SALINAS62]MBS1302352.1 TerB family tellurite resistance protein [Loktanella sp. SALINAS62]